MYKIRFDFRSTREEQNLTQKELGRMAGISQTHISELELFKESPTLDTVAKICTALQKHPSDLLVYD